MLNTIHHHLPDEHATAARGAALAACLAPGLLVWLHGDLGAGKTALTRALLHAAGYTGRVKSPTYALAEPYQLQHPRLGPLRIVHFDLYRMASPEEFIDAGLGDELDGNTICLIEWPDKGAGVLPPPDWRITLDYVAHGRNFTLSACTERGKECLSRFHFAAAL